MKLHEITPDDVPLAFHLISDALAAGKKVTMELEAEKNDAGEMGLVAGKITSLVLLGAAISVFDFRMKYIDSDSAHMIVEVVLLTRQQLEDATIKSTPGGIHVYFSYRM